MKSVPKSTDSVTPILILVIRRPTRISRVPMAIQKQFLPIAPPQGKASDALSRRVGPERASGDLGIQCDRCKAIHSRELVARNLHVCPDCQHHFPIPAPERIAQLLDAGLFEEWHA